MGRLKKYLEVFKKNIFSIDFLILLLIIIFLVSITAPINFLHSDSSTLVLKTLDEDAFQRVIFKIHHGLTTMNPNEITISAFLSYGWTYFFLNAIATLPFHLFGWESAIIVIPRIISAICAAISVFLIYKIAFIKMARPVALLIAVFLLLMPALYDNAFWMHPDHMVTALVLLCMYLLFKDELEFKKYFILALAVLGFALTIKLTALVFFVVPILYVFYGLIIKFKKIKILIKHFLLIGVIPPLVFLIFNPTVLIPGRFGAIIESVKKSTIDNKTNHGNDISEIDFGIIFDKVINDYYFSNIIIIIFILLFCVGIYYETRSRSKKPIILLSGFWFLFFLLYNLTQVLKLWQHYYLPVFMVAPLALVTLIYFKKLKKTDYVYLILVLLFIQGLYQMDNLSSVFLRNKSLEFNRDYGAEIDVSQQKQVSEHAVSILANQSISANTVLVSPYLPFPEEFYNLNYFSLNRIYGALSEIMLGVYDFPDLIILNKEDKYFTDQTDENLKKMTSYDDIVAGHEYIEKLITGYDINTNQGLIKYDIVTNDDLVLILLKKRYE